MQTSVNKSRLVLVFLACLVSFLASRATAQTFTRIYSFSGYDHVTGINSDGAVPFGDIVISSNTVYGTTLYGGSSGIGTVFAVNTDGSDFKSLYSFSGGGGGKWPSDAGLVISGSTLYGTTCCGGNGVGNEYAINTDGSGFTDLYDFSFGDLGPSGVRTNADGNGPNFLVLCGNMLYGTASGGGTYGAGTVFAVNTDGTGFTTIHTGNTDWHTPGWISTGNTLYATLGGGEWGEGSVLVFSFRHS